MSTKRQRGNSWTYVFKKSLDKPLYLTFHDEVEGDEYARKLDLLLDRGIVPAQYQPEDTVSTIATLVRMYCRDAHPSQKDRDVLETVITMVGPVMLPMVDAQWVDDWITDMKRIHKLAPGTIRAKAGALARCADWGMRKKLLVMPDHPFRSLPDGYARYTELDASLAGESKTDQERDRRLEFGEFDKIIQVIDGGSLTRKHRPYTIEHIEAVKVLFILALESAMRLREMYTLTLDQVSIQKKTVFLDRTKNGSKRQVPLSSVALSTLGEYMKLLDVSDADAGSNLFPWWGGSLDQRKLKLLSNFLSKLYREIFAEAGCVDLHFHDLRHEAVSRMFERTSLSDIEVMRISGHKSHAMMMRYTNLRGSTLSEKLW